MAIETTRPGAFAAPRLPLVGVGALPRRWGLGAHSPMAPALFRAVPPTPSLPHEGGGSRALPVAAAVGTQEGPAC